MNILMLSAEAFPFAKTGGMGDAVSSLSKALSKIGHNVKILIPRYYNIDRANLELCLSGVVVKDGDCEVKVDFYYSKLFDNVEVYFLDYEKYFGREGIYGSNNECDYYDNPARFAFFSRAAFFLCIKINWTVDIIHCHDWSTAFACLLKKYFYSKGFFEKTATVLTIHNIGYQGRYPSGAFSQLNLPENLRLSSGLEQGTGINFLKAGITCADFITTVSPTYASEIRTSSGGFFLDGLIRVRSDALMGILNGIDTEEWNPQKDKLIPFSYSKVDLCGKHRCKSLLQAQFHLENSENPLIAMVSRLADQKGIAEVFAPMYGCIYRICTELPVQFVILGSGESWYENEIRSLESKLPNFRSYIGYSERLSHLFEAGADFFLMPSKYEPCGLNQIYSMLYGTIPIVRNTGGLSDTVEQFDEQTCSGTGFLFNDLTPDAIYNTVKYAVSVYLNNKSAIRKMQMTGMSKNFSWERSAKKYEEAYSKALSSLQNQ